MSTDLQLKSSCSGCGSTTDLYGSNCKHMTLCLGCGKTMADKRAKCVDCGATLTRLIREYNVRASSPIDKNYFIGRFINGLPDFSKKKSAENKWSLQKDGLHGRQITDTLREKYKNKPWLLEDESGQSQFQGHLEGSQSATYYLLMKERKEFVAIPAGSWYNFNKVAQYKQLTLEEVEEKMKNRKKTADGYQRWMMKAANNGPAAFGEHGEFDDKESYTGGGRSHKKTSEHDEGHVSVKGEEDEEEESERKSRLGLNKRSGDDDEEGPRGGDHDLDDDVVEKALNKEMAMNVPKIIPDMSKLEPLDGTNYRRWSQKLLILFEALEVDYVLSEDPPAETVSPATPVVTPLSGGTKKADEEVKKKYEKDNKTVRGHLLIHMANNLFDLFINQKSAKVIWDTLLKRYGDDDAGKRKYVVGNWLRFQMLDDKPIMEQVHEYENLVGDILNEGMKICEILQANVLLEKFPPSWSDYRNQLKHKKRDLSLQELINHMKIEEANRLQDKHVLFSKNSVNANVVEISDQNRFKGKGKEKKFQKNGQHKNHTGINRGDNKIQKKKLVCYVCGKPGHKAYQCYMRQGQQNQNQKPLVPFAPQAHLAKNEEVIAAMVVEANLVDNKVDWILDTGASKHLCANKELFHHFEDAANGECVFMGNSATARVLGDDREHEEIFTDDDEAVGNDPEEREDLAPEVPAPPEIKQDEEEEEDEDNEEGEGLSKSGKELKKLLGKASGLNESDAEDDDDDDDDVDDDVDVPPVIATKQKDALKEEPIDNSPSKPTATGPARGTPSSKSSKGKRKLNEEAKPSNTATPRKEPKLSAKDVNGSASKSGAPPKGTPPLSSKGGSSTTTTASGPVSEEEIRAVLRQKTPVTTQDLVAKFKARLRCLEDKQAFAEILKRITMIQKTTTGATYVILRDK